MSGFEKVSLSPTDVEALRGSIQDIIDMMSLSISSSSSNPGHMISALDDYREKKSWELESKLDGDFSLLLKVFISVHSGKKCYVDVGSEFLMDPVSKKSCWFHFKWKCEENLEYDPDNWQYWNSL